MLVPNTVISDRYRIIELLAEGGVGQVYAAEHVMTEEQVAIKVLLPHIVSSARTVEAFREEAKISARIRSRFVVQIHDAGFWKDPEGATRPYLVMERLYGRTLGELVSQLGAIPATRALTYVGEIVQALENAHNYVDRHGQLKPIIHRDLKPDNLFLARERDGTNHVKILDFGMAKILGNDKSASQEIRGTPLFMSVEQARGGPITPQTDIWAIGLVVYYLLSGHHYWKTSQGEAPVLALLNELANEPLVAPSYRYHEITQKDPPWPTSFDGWFLGCVTREPERRFRTIRQMFLALKGVWDTRGRAPSQPPNVSALADTAGTLTPSSRPSERRSFTPPYASTLPLGAKPKGSPSPASSARSSPLASTTRMDASTLVLPPSKKSGRVDVYEHTELAPPSPPPPPPGSKPLAETTDREREEDE